LGQRKNIKITSFYVIFLLLPINQYFEEINRINHIILATSTSWKARRTIWSYDQ
jgi:hypothetical protein